jgi:hypothetical protein
VCKSFKFSKHAHTYIGDRKTPSFGFGKKIIKHQFWICADHIKWCHGHKEATCFGQTYFASFNNR